MNRRFEILKKILILKDNPDSNFGYKRTKII